MALQWKSSVSALAIDWFSGYTLLGKLSQWYFTVRVALQWKSIGPALAIDFFKLLSIGRNVISEVFYCPSCITVAVKWHSIGVGLVEWLPLVVK